MLEGRGIKVSQESAALSHHAALDVTFTCTCFPVWASMVISVSTVNRSILPRVKSLTRRALPDVVLIRLQDMPTLDMSLKVLCREAAEQHCGRQAVLDRLIEVVFIQVLRDLMDQQRLQVGLLAGLAEPRLAKAINAMHNVS